MTSTARSPRLALILSLCLPGLGQFYNRDWLKGLAFLVVGLVVSEYALSGISLESILERLPPDALLGLLAKLVLATGLLLWSGYDAWKSASKRSPDATAEGL